MWRRLTCPFCKRNWTPWDYERHCESLASGGFSGGGGLFDSGNFPESTQLNHGKSHTNLPGMYRNWLEL